MSKKKYSDRYISKRRAIGIYGILILLFIGLTTVLFRVMVLDSKGLKEKAMRQWTSKVKIAAKRGRILDRRGKELAISGNLFRVDLDLNTLRDGVKKEKFTLEELAKDIAPIVDMTEEEVYEKLTIKGSKGEDLGYSILKRRIEDDVANKLKALALEKEANGIIISPDTKRYYPNGNFASQVIGHTNSDGKGLTGIEYQYDDELSGISGEILTERDNIQQDLPYGIAQYYPAVDGKDVVLTLDETIQGFAEKYANEALTNNSAEAVSIIVMNPNNGEVLAMATAPGYDLNDPWVDGVDGDELQKLWRNRAVSDAMEPGSVYKVITAYAALAEGIVTDVTKVDFNCTGVHYVGKSSFHCWKHGGHGAQSFEQILQNSCNPGFGSIGEKLGAEKVEEYAKLFGFGSKTGIDLPGETSGIVKKASDMYPIDTATISFGQADTNSMVQYMAAFNAVANGGQYITPHLMKEIVGKDSKGNDVVEKEYEPVINKKILSTETTKILRECLEKVVSEGGGRNAYVEGYNIAGKTGTAQIPNPNGGGYEPGKYLSTFVGMAPAENPQITVMVSILKPDPAKYYAGQIAAPVGRELFSDIFNYLALGPSSYDFKPEVTKDVMIPEIRGISKEDAIKILKEKGLKYQIEGEGTKISDTNPKPGFSIEEGSKIILYTSDDENYNNMVGVPNLRGYSKERAIETLDSIGLKYNFIGNSGIVVNQSISKETEVVVGTSISLTLEEVGD
ncbi:stage V sporulation protein D [Clostridium bornimense]|uniref:Stage V sporulation protein D n=1 Tax=Clostridium bornimense TaxID=1216932 RepID=W6RVN8_9CLOT|nr:stage V sporulation protein D [Clostridium bornimense]CDM68766.1 stage V sporulation protein D [Clostridium bornimense]